MGPKSKHLECYPPLFPFYSQDLGIKPLKNGWNDY